MGFRTHAGLVAVLGLVASVLVAVGVATPAQAAVTVYPVPTSGASLGRIVTAPNGDMWFAMGDANKIGRITPAGVITEFDLGPQTTSESSVYGIDVGADGWVWVNHDSGWKTSRINPTTGEQQLMATFPYPYAGEVRVTPDGAGWITLNYDESGVIRVVPGHQPVWTANAPGCDDVLGLGSDGAAWCKSDVNMSGLVRVGADADSGVQYPLPANATYPEGIAAGPVGTVWFTRNSGGTMFTYANSGSIGYLDAATGATKIWSTGSRSAPSDLVRGPDGDMWFTNVGGAPAIGHISATGVGAVTAVGNYSPRSLTFAADGAVWFTDAKNNVIVRVTTDHLQTTNVDLGDGVEMTAPGGPGPDPGPGPGADTQLGALGRTPKVGVVKRRRLKVALTCPVSATAGCAGAVRILPRKGKGALTKSRSYKLAGGAKATVRLKFTRPGLRALRKGKAVKVRIRLSAPGSKSVTRTIKVRRR